MNDKKFTLLDLPLPIESPSDITTTEPLKIQLHITPNIDSKTLTSSKKRGTFFYIKTNPLRIENITHEKQEFITPADFHIGFQDPHFHEMYHKTIGVAPEDTIEYYKNINVIAKAPVAYPSILSSHTPYKTIPMKFKVNKTEYDVKIVEYVFGDSDIPTEPIKEYYEKMKESRFFDKIICHLRQIFEERPILNKTNELLDVKLFNEKYDLNISKYFYYSFLPLVAYFTKKGPWQRCWIKFGYDPRKDYLNYKYQRISKYKIGNIKDFLNFMPDIEKNVLENESKYISKNYCDDMGFFKKELIKYLKKSARKDKIDEIVS